MAQIDDLNNAVAAAQQAVSDLQARDAQVVAGVQALQQEVTNLQQQVDANQPVDLTNVTSQVQSLASVLGSVDVESTDIPQDPNQTPPQPAPTDQPVNTPDQPNVTPQPGDQPAQQ